MTHSNNLILLNSSILISSGNVSLLLPYLHSITNDLNKDTIDLILALLLTLLDEYEPQYDLVLKELLQFSSTSKKEEVKIKEIEILNILDKDPISISEKVSYLKFFLQKQCEKWGYMIHSDTNQLSLWVKACLRKCYSCNKTRNYDELISLIVEEENWINLIWNPLRYYQSLSEEEGLEVSQFEQMNEVERLSLIIDKAGKVSSNMRKFIKSLSDSSIIEYIGSVQTNNNRQLFIIVLNILELRAGKSNDLGKILEDLCIKYQGDLNDVELLHIMDKTLRLFGKKNQLIKILDVSKLLIKLNWIILPLSELINISVDKSKQLIFLQNFLLNINKSNHLESIITDLYILKEILLNLIPSQDFDNLLIGRLLDIEAFEILKTTKLVGSNYDTDLLIGKFWKYIKKAEFIINDESLISAMKILELMEKNINLHNFINLLQTISKILQGDNTFKPISLLHLTSTEPLLLKLLEKNPSLYKNPQKLLDIQNCLQEILLDNVSCRFSTYSWIKRACIESALSFDDLNFAIDESLKILSKENKKKEILEGWITFLQVSKHISSDEYSSQEITIQAQLQIISQLLIYVKGQDSIVCLRQFELLDSRLKELLLEREQYGSNDVFKFGFDGNKNLLVTNKNGFNTGGIKELSESGKGLIRKFGELF